MMTAEKIDFFKESMNASYIAIPANVPHTQNSTNTDFMKTLEKSSASEKHDMLLTDKPFKDQKATTENFTTPKKEEGVDSSKSQQRKEQYEQVNTERETEKKSATEKPKEKLDEKQVEQEQTKKTDNSTTESGETNKVRKVSGSEERATVIKEVLKQHQVQIQRISEIKDDMKQNFTETKSMTPTNMAEKLLLQKLGDDKGHSPKEAKSTTPKSEETSSDKKMMKEVTTAQKNDAETLQKNEPKTEKTVKNSDSTIFSLTNDTPKTQPTIPEAKINKIPTPQTLLDQYEGLKDKINQNVENSIKFLLANGENRISMKLYPPELGRVEVELTIKDNKIHAKINTENMAVKEVIQSNLEQLKSNLQNAGTTIYRMDVEVGGFKNQFEQNFSNGNSNGSGRRGNNGSRDNDSSKDANELSPGKIVNHKAQSYFLGRSINVII